MPAFRDVSIQRKLIAILMLASGFALVLACSGFVLYEAVMYRGELIRELSTISQIVSDSSVAALAFNDPRAARDTLAVLKAEPQILHGCIHDRRGRSLAEYTLWGATTSRGECAGNDGPRFWKDRVEFFHPVVFDGERIGTVHLEFRSSPPLEISVNLSARQFRQPDLVDRISQILEETGIEPSCLQLELTESVLVDDATTVLGTLNRLKGLGVGLKIDDFGTGYSSLHYLNQLPFDSLKIDRSFVVNMCGDPTCGEIVKTVVALARSLGLEVIAEGVETEEQLERLKALGCEFGQGFLFSRPIEKAQARALLAEAGK